MFIIARTAKKATCNMHEWEEEDSLWLFTKEEFDQLPDGIELTSISGDQCVKGKDYIDMDIRFGYMAYGVKNPWEHPLKDLFLIFELKK